MLKYSITSFQVRERIFGLNLLSICAVRGSFNVRNSFDKFTESKRKFF